MINLTGERFGKLTVLKPLAKRTKSKNVIWLCRCECGNQTEVASNDLRTNRTKSCGCLKHQAPEEHKDGVLLSHLSSTVARKDNRTGLRGVTPMRNKFQARIGLCGKVYHLGTFETAKEAYAEYLKAKEKLHLPLLRKHHYPLS